jgi:hypothetical protein
LNFILGPWILKDKSLPWLYRSGQDHKRSVVADRGCIGLLFEHHLSGSLSPDNEPNFLARARTAAAIPSQLKKRMGRERLWKFLPDSAYLPWLIEKLIAAFVAPDCKTGVQGGHRHFAFRSAKWNSMALEEATPNMKPLILANDCPAIIVVFPH